MYIWKNEKLKISNIKNASEVIGVSRQFLSSVFAQKISIRKLTAYCIVKYIDSNAEINDYFIRKEK